MKFSEKPLTPEEIKTAEQEDESARRNGRMRFLGFKYRYAIHAPCPGYEDPKALVRPLGICRAPGEYTPPPPIKNFIMPHGGYYAVMKECIARKIPWEELLNAEPYLTRLRKEQAEKSQDHYKYVPAFSIYQSFPDYFNRKELQAGFTWKQLMETDLPPFEPVEMYLEPMVLFKKREADLLKEPPEHYEEIKKYYEERQKVWEKRYLPRLEALGAARAAICRAATKFFLENDELPAKPQKGAGEAWQRA